MMSYSCGSIHETAQKRQILQNFAKNVTQMPRSSDFLKTTKLCEELCLPNLAGPSGKHCSCSNPPSSMVVHEIEWQVELNVRIFL